MLLDFELVRVPGKIVTRDCKAGKTPISPGSFSDWVRDGS
jgi:hypothetical protein